MLRLGSPARIRYPRLVTSSPEPIDRLLEIMARLREGCPWDREQTFATVVPYTIEEAYEVADAVERQDLPALRDELGDLLLQVVFHSRMAEEVGAFDFNDVVNTICDKMVRRHPHVFAEESYASVEAQTAAWDAIKASERAAKAQDAESILDDVPSGLPALMRAVKLTGRAARVGFDWPDAAAVIEKLREEVEELDAEIKANERDKAAEELGDLLFVCANLGRKLKVDPEDALRRANAKFMRRFSFIEQALAAGGRKPEDSDLPEMDSLWDEAKRVERMA